MTATYNALALLLSYPSADSQSLAPVAAQVLKDEARLPADIRGRLADLAGDLAGGDLYDLQERYVWLFDRTRSLSLNLYEHVHGESRDRGQAMVGLIELYRRHGLEPCSHELPDHLPVFLEFLSILPGAEAASLLGEASHVLSAIQERLEKRDSPYAAVFAALACLAGAADQAALAAIRAEPDDDPDDLEAIDRLWAETAVTFGPSDVGCPKAEVFVQAMQAEPPARPVRRRGLPIQERV